jgi:GxxExxY protein
MKNVCFMNWKRQVSKGWKTKSFALIYDEVRLDIGYRLDLMIEDKFIVEIKSVESLNDVHLAQILTYLRYRIANWDYSSILMSTS